MLSVCPWGVLQSEFAGRHPQKPKTTHNSQPTPTTRTSTPRAPTDDGVGRVLSPPSLRGHPCLATSCTSLRRCGPSGRKNHHGTVGCCRRLSLRPERVAELSLLPCGDDGVIATSPSTTLETLRQRAPLAFSSDSRRAQWGRTIEDDSTVDDGVWWLLDRGACLNRPREEFP